MKHFVTFLLGLIGCCIYVQPSPLLVLNRYSDHNFIIIEARAVSRQANNIQQPRIGSITYNQSTGRLIALNVEQDFQRQGVGSILFREAIRALSKTHSTIEWISTKEAVPFYLKQGAFISETPDSDSDSDDDLYLNDNDDNTIVEMAYIINKTEPKMGIKHET